MSNDFDFVSPDSRLTHANMLTGIERLNPESIKKTSDHEILFSFYSRDNDKNGIETDLDQFKKSNKKSLSLTLIDANLGPDGKLQGGSHWTTLHFRKSDNGKISCYYSDSMQSGEAVLPQKVRLAVEKSGVKTEDIRGMECQLQTGNKCGDHSLFNAYAMTEMTEEELQTRKIKASLNIPKPENFSVKDDMKVEDFIKSNRSHLASEYNSVIPEFDYSQKSQALDKCLGDKSQSPDQNLNQDRVSALELLSADIKTIYQSQFLNDETKAFAISNIEQQNLKLLQDFTSELKQKKPGINQELIEQISSPIVANNFDDFKEQLKSLANPNQDLETSLGLFASKFDQKKIELQTDSKSNNNIVKSIDSKTPTEKLVAKAKEEDSLSEIRKLSEQVYKMHKEQPPKSFKTQTREEILEKNPAKKLYQGNVEFLRKNPYIDYFLGGVEKIENRFKERFNPQRIPRKPSFNDTILVDNPRVKSKSFSDLGIEDSLQRPSLDQQPAKPDQLRRKLKGILKQPKVDHQSDQSSSISQSSNPSTQLKTTTIDRLDPIDRKAVENATKKLRFASDVKRESKGDGNMIPRISKPGNDASRW